MTENVYVISGPDLKVGFGRGEREMEMEKSGDPGKQKDSAPKNTAYEQLGGKIKVKNNLQKG